MKKMWPYKQPLGTESHCISRGLIIPMFDYLSPLYSFLLEESLTHENRQRKKKDKAITWMRVIIFSRGELYYQQNTMVSFLVEPHSCLLNGLKYISDLGYKKTKIGSWRGNKHSWCQ